MKFTTKSKEEIIETNKILLALMVTIVALYPPFKDVFEAKNYFLLENIPLIALATSVIFAIGMFSVIIGYFYYVNKK